MIERLKSGLVTGLVGLVLASNVSGDAYDALNAALLAKQGKKGEAGLAIATSLQEKQSEQKAPAQPAPREPAPLFITMEQLLAAEERNPGTLEQVYQTYYNPGKFSAYRSGSGSMEDIYGAMRGDIIGFRLNGRYSKGELITLNIYNLTSKEWISRISIRAEAFHSWETVDAKINGNYRKGAHIALIFSGDGSVQALQGVYKFGISEETRKKR